MSKNIRLILAWALASLVAVLAQFRWLAASLVDGRYVPVGNDSFYHARRILDAALGPGGVVQYDTHINAPYGSLVIWPWGYDTAVAAWVSLLLKSGMTANPMQALVMTPVVAAPLSIALIVTIAALLRLPAFYAFLAAALVAVSPLTQTLHGVGVVDHHFAEYILVLASLAAGLGWLNRREKVWRAALFGTLLGIAPACHPAMFLLQVPIVGTALLLWWRCAPLPLRATAALSAALVAGTAFVLVPSEAARLGLFEYLRLSWFQLYVAVSSAIIMLLTCRLPRSWAGAAILLFAGAVLAIPLLNQLQLAGHFLGRDFAALATVHEAKSLPALALEPGGPALLSTHYSLLVWFVPLVLAGSLWSLSRERDAALIFFYMAAAAGLLMLVAMFRMHDYGSFALLLPPLLWLAQGVRRGTIDAARAPILAGVAVLIACVPSIREAFFSPAPAAGGEPYYAITRAIYPAVADVCRQDPGIVLASNNDGHYLRFHTECSVIATNFLVTREDEQALLRTQRLLAMSPDEFIAGEFGVKYILARGQRMLVSNPNGQLAFLNRDAFARFNPRLVSALLLQDPRSLGPHFKLVAELRLDAPGGYAYARLFEISSRPK